MDEFGEVYCFRWAMRVSLAWNYISVKGVLQGYEPKKGVLRGHFLLHYPTQSASPLPASRFHLSHVAMSCDCLP